MTVFIVVERISQARGFLGFMLSIVGLVFPRINIIITIGSSGVSWVTRL